MTGQAVPVTVIASVCEGHVVSALSGDPLVTDLLIDSRRLIHPGGCLFVALITDQNDGHRYINELRQKGVSLFLVKEIPGESPGAGADSLPPACFIVVQDTLMALQKISAFHRLQFDLPVIGITGSNGKTIVKEWLFQMLSPGRNIVRSPKSYNSQVGVPLSVWKMAPGNDLAIFEAGISRPGEMEKLEAIIRPSIGIFTNIGPAHDEHFKSRREKVEEKLKLFTHAQTLIYCADHPLITECLDAVETYRHLRRFTWSRYRDADLHITALNRNSTGTRITASFQNDTFGLDIPFTDDASVENAIHCITCWLLLQASSIQHPASSIQYPASSIQYPASSIQHPVSRLQPLISQLTPLALRLELKEAINHCSLINDSYNSDITSLIIALDFLGQQKQHSKRTVILSDILQTGREKDALYREIANLMTSRNITRIIGIGRDMVRYGHHFPMESAFFMTTDDFLAHYPLSAFQHETILLKGARLFEFERIDQVLQQKSHETVMEINLDAMVHNLNHFRSLLHPGTKVMAMVKAFSYGSGSFEIANLLQFHRIDYLAVAYADEGVELRKAGIHLPVMVMSPEEQSLETILKYNLEPEIYSLQILHQLEAAIERNVTSIQQEVNVHIKLDTGMHRLGFDERELPALLRRLRGNPAIRIRSVFSHLASSEDPADDEFTRLQISRFKLMSDRVAGVLDYPVLRHILNSAGISRFPEAHFDMVRLGIGLYGIGSDPGEQSLLRNVSTLKTVITQIRQVPAGDRIGYNRKGIALKDMTIAVVPVGYADGLDRRLSNGKGVLWINDQPAPIVGNICMDLTMIDVTGILDTGSWIQYPETSIQKPVSSIQYPVSSIQHPVSSIQDVIIFDDRHPVSELAAAIGTIPYEVLTGISGRVKRIYYYE